MSAREDSLWYRASRFVRRHQSGVAFGVLIALSLCGAILAVLLEVRAALNAGPQRLSGRAILGPLNLLWSCLAPTWFGGAVFLTRAKLRRAGGALAGGMLFGAIWIVEYRIDHLMGWWRNRLAETSHPLSISGLVLPGCSGHQRGVSSRFLAPGPPFRLDGRGCLYRRGRSYRHRREQIVV